MRLLFIDLKKAFDTVDHAILVKKLNVYGVRRLSNSWTNKTMYSISIYTIILLISVSLSLSVCGAYLGSLQTEF